MLYINNQEYQLLSNEIRCVECYGNNIKGYSALVEITFIHDNIKGYICFYVDFFDNKNFNNIENKTYIELPTELETKIDMIEIYDTKTFIDFIDSEVKVIFGNIIDNKIETEIYIDDEYIKVKYNGKLKLNYNL